MKSGSRSVAGSVAALFLAAAGFLIWFALSDIPDLWVMLNAWLQPR